jgi:hypothetical protein
LLFYFNDALLINFKATLLFDGFVGDRLQLINILVFAIVVIRVLVIKRLTQFSILSAHHGLVSVLVHAGSRLRVLWFFAFVVAYLKNFVIIIFLNKTLFI